MFYRVSLQLMKPLMKDPDDAAAGGVWVDPPNYFEKIVYPAYITAHEQMFAGGDVEHGPLADGWTGRIGIVEPLEGAKEMTKAFDAACGDVAKAVRAGKGTELNRS